MGIVSKNYSMNITKLMTDDFALAYACGPQEEL